MRFKIALVLALLGVVACASILGIPGDVTLSDNFCGFFDSGSFDICSFAP
jgi:hypothetical protein